MRRVDAPGVEAPRTTLEKFFHEMRREAATRPLTDAEKVHGTKAGEFERLRTALEQHYNAPKPEPPPRPLTEIEKVYGRAVDTGPAARPSTALERYVLSAEKRRVIAKPEGAAFDPCSDCNGSGRITYPPDSRGIINRSACPKCHGRGKVFREGSTV
jgi:hypothetical protein